MRLHLALEEVLLARLHEAGQHQGRLRLARHGDSAVRPLVVVEAADPEQVVVLVGAEGKVPTTIGLPITATTSSASGACSAW